MFIYGVLPKMNTYGFERNTNTMARTGEYNTSKVAAYSSVMSGYHSNEHQHA